jgi:hypothetical protein
MTFAEEALLFFAMTVPLALILLMCYVIDKLANNDLRFGLKAVFILVSIVALCLGALATIFSYHTS